MTHFRSSLENVDRAPNLRLAVVGDALFGLERHYRTEVAARLETLYQTVLPRAS